jgi:dTDP-4-dehydrorhamnose reductase
MTEDDTTDRTVLVTGGSGLLGAALTEEIKSENPTVSTYKTEPVSYAEATIRQLDLRSSDGIKEVVTNHEPDIVFHCAAMTDVDCCETNPRVAREVNLAGTRKLASVVADEGGQFVFVSTDAVYGGEGKFHRETDETRTLNVYTDTKLRAEMAVTDVHPDPLIVRTAFHGHSPGSKRSLSEWIYGSLANGDSVGLFTDAFFTPLYVGDLAELLVDAVRDGATGTYNMASTDRVSKYEFGLQLASVFDLPADLIERNRQSEHGFTAERPVDNSLSVAKATEELGYAFPSVEEGLCRMRADLPD